MCVWNSLLSKKENWRDHNGQNGKSYFDTCSGSKMCSGTYLFCFHDLPQICKKKMKKNPKTKNLRPIWRHDCVETLWPIVLYPSLYIKFVSRLLSTIAPPALTTAASVQTHSHPGVRTERETHRCVQYIYIVNCEYRPQDQKKTFNFKHVKKIFSALCRGPKCYYREIGSF